MGTVSLLPRRMVETHGVNPERVEKAGELPGVELGEGMITP